MYSGERSVPLRALVCRWCMEAKYSSRSYSRYTVNQVQNCAFTVEPREYETRVI